jgi:hypothetical protein
MRMLVSVEFADAGTKSGTHRVLIIGRGPESPAAGDIGLSLEEAKTHSLAPLNANLCLLRRRRSWRRAAGAAAGRSSPSTTGSCAGCGLALICVPRVPLETGAFPRATRVSSVQAIDSRLIPVP